VSLIARTNNLNPAPGVHKTSFGKGTEITKEKGALSRALSSKNRS